LLVSLVATGCHHAGKAARPPTGDGGPLDGASASGREVPAEVPAEIPAEVGPTLSLRPRWVAVGSQTDLSVVRFDNPSRPVTTILAWVAYAGRGQPSVAPALVLEAQTRDDAEVVVDRIRWSLDGSHLGFATRTKTADRHWVASAADGFVPRELIVAGADAIDPRWIGDEILVVAALSAGGPGGQVDFVRVHAPELTQERLGSYTGTGDNRGEADNNASFLASRFGALVTLGSPSAGELWLVRGQDSLTYLGPALPRYGSPCQFDLTWSADGESALWWGLPASLYRGYPPTESCDAAPALAVVPGAAPRLGLVLEPSRLAQQSEYDGNSGVNMHWVTWTSAEFPAGAPSGSTVAYGACFRQTTPARPTGDGSVVPARQGTLVVEDGLNQSSSIPPRREAGASVCDRQQRFGFINATDYYFSRSLQLDGGSERFQLVLNLQGEDRVVYDQVSGDLTGIDVLAKGRHLYFTALENGGRGEGLWHVDLTRLTPTAERLALDGVLSATVSPQVPTATVPKLRGHSGIGYPTDQPARGSDREALLVATSTAWWVVDFDGPAAALLPLDPAWQAWNVAWTSDGQGVLAANGASVFLDWGPGQARYPLADVGGTLFGW
jgi:hypothetical protein